MEGVRVQREIIETVLNPHIFIVDEGHKLMTSSTRGGNTHRIGVLSVLCSRGTTAFVAHTQDLPIFQ